MSDKATVQAEQQAAQAAFEQAVAGLSDEQWTRPALDQWSVREVAAHLAGWHEQLGLGLERIAQGQRPTPEGVDWSDVQGWNDGFAEGVTDATPAEVRDRLSAALSRFSAALEAVPADRFGEGKTVNKLAAGAGFEHLREHAEQIQTARAEGKLG